MKWLIKFGIILGLFLYVPVAIKASSLDNGYEQCERTVKKWASSSIDYEIKDNEHKLRDLLFFLHVPRTGGRTYFHCFLKKLYSNSHECPRSYDKLRFNPSFYSRRKANCQLLSTHDDYSIISKLPKEKTSMVTILRNPIERVLSTYEFSIEVAARFLFHSNLTSVSRMGRLARSRRKKSALNTLDIWPWKYLVPWMREDLFARRDARELTRKTILVTHNPYDMEDRLMPLHEYINHPIAQDIVHNGATFQIAGLTNNSFTTESHDVRHCVQRYHILGEYVLEVAKKRLDDMLYVGLTENHKESATIFANIVGAQVISNHILSSSRSDDPSDNSPEQSNLLPDTSSDTDDRVNVTKVLSGKKDEVARENWTVGKVMEEYETCMVSLRNTQAERRVNSLKQISPANFTKKARNHVSQELIQEIASLNSLDVELYNYAEYIFKKQQIHLTQNTFSADTENTGFTSSNSNISISLSWIFMSLAITALALVSFFLFFNARRRTSKVKL